MIVVSLVMGIIGGASSAQTVSENWLKQVGVTCGGGISEETKREVEEKVRESLALTTSDTETKVFKAEDVQNLLSAFSDERKGEAYSQYVKCIVSVINASASSASETEGKDISDISLDAPPQPEDIQVVSGDVNLTVKPGDFFGLRTEDLMFFVQDIGEWGNEIVLYYEYTDIEYGRNIDGKATEGRIIDPRNDCAVIPYRIDLENKIASIRVKC